MSRELFNFIWVSGRKGNTIQIGPDVDTVEASVHKAKEAVIMYPTLFTPAVYVQGSSTPVVELLIAAKETLTPADVNVHLKISIGLDPEKAYDPRPLFIDLQADDIVLRETKPDGNRILHTARRFSGILAQEVAGVYEPYAHIYQVQVRDAAIQRSRPPLLEKLSTRMTVGGLENAIVGQEAEDISIAAFLQDAPGHGGASGPIPGKRRYGFKINDDDTIDFSSVNPDEPIQSYHPLFVWDSTVEFANFGHVSDIHLNARLAMLRRSPAAVVEDPARSSPEVGALLVDTNNSFASVLGKMRQDATLHALAVGGDLIDHIRNTYQASIFQAASPSVSQIWNAVDLQAGGMHDRYPAGVDYLVFYSMIVDFCRRSNKPIFGISGNHDAYEEPFGISPRIAPARGNAGIPADLNLTFYEALLAFGPTWATVINKSNFNHDWWVWFYRVFGGFNDFVVRLPRQAVVGLGWGSQEDMLLDEQGPAHLPRSDDAVTKQQLALFDLAMPPHVIVFAHFTVLSFDDPLSMIVDKQERTGTLSEELNDFNMGTFESFRPQMIDLLRSPKIQLMISGHSHRRATYQINPGESEKAVPTGSSVQMIKVLSVTMHDTKTVGSRVGGFRAPVIAVSDSAGPMPRLNIADEFGQWGSDVASGTVATFSLAEETKGALSSMAIVPADRPRPRVAVALDYLDITFDPSQVLSGTLTSDAFSITDEAAAVAADKEFYKLTLPLQPIFMTRTKASVRKFTLHGAVEKGNDIEWLYIELQPLDASGQRWSVPAALTKKFQSWANNSVESFVGLVLQSSDGFLSSHYNWEDPWYFEVVTDAPVTMQGTSAAICQYISKRPSRWSSGAAVSNWRFREVPDFDWRRDKLKSKYGA